MQDGAHWQSRAVLVCLQGLNDGKIEASYNEKTNKHDVTIEVARWENGREQGYICSLVVPFAKQLNICFFEHRNSDEICAVKWEQVSMNSIGIVNMDTKGTIYQDKYDVSFKVKYGKFLQMAEWIKNEFDIYYANNKTDGGDKTIYVLTSNGYTTYYKTERACNRDYVSQDFIEKRIVSNNEYQRIKFIDE